MGLGTRAWTLAAGAADLRQTGYPDLFLATDYGVNEFWANEGGRRFRNRGKETGVGITPKSGMNVAFGDISNQGRFAIYVTNITEPGNLVQYNNLWVPREGTAGDTIRYDNLAVDMGVGSGGWSFGAQFGDLNNDGFLDLYLTNGYISGESDQSYWYDYSKIVGGNKAIVRDAKHWPPIGNRSLSGHQQKRVWLSDRAGRFTDIAPAVGVRDTYDGRAVALSDLDRDGDLDVLVANQKGPLLLYKNTAAPKNSWIAFDLEGVRSNRSAIGAQVRVFWNGMQQVQEVTGGIGFCAQNGRTLHFGLGEGAAVDRAEIRWPSGKMQTLPSPEVRKVHTVKEPS